MPCNTIQYVTLAETLEGVDIDTLADTLDSLGFTVAKSKAGTLLSFSGVQDGKTWTGTYSVGGKMTVSARGYSSKFNFEAVKDAYSHNVVQKAATAYGWKLTPTGDNTYDAVKEGY